MRIKLPGEDRGGPGTLMFVLELVLVIWRQCSGLEALTGPGWVLSDV